MASISAPVHVQAVPSQQQTKSIYRQTVEPLAERIHNNLPGLRSQLSRTTESDCSKCSIVCISDTHCSQPLLPPGDILLHAGDLSNSGSFDEIQAQLDWLNLQPHAHKVIIAGNHDKLLDDAFTASQLDFPLEESKTREYLRWGSVIYLQNSSTTVGCGPSSSGDTVKSERQLHIYGAPQTPDCGRWAFQHVSIRDVWSNTVPRNIDVLICHGPPAGFLDRAVPLRGGGPARSYGDEFLLREIYRVRPRLVVFGHIHDGYGRENVVLDEAEVAYLQVMRFHGGVRALMWLVWGWVSRILRVKAGIGGEIRETMLVNAAICQGAKNSPIVVTL